MNNASNYLISIFDAVPLPCIILQQTDLNYIIVDANNAFTTITHASKTDIIGSSLSTIVVDGNTNKNESFNRIISSINTATTSKQVHTVNDIKLAINKNTGFEYWSITHSPILNNKGEVNFILQSFTNTTAATKASIEITENKEDIFLQKAAFDNIKNNQSAIINSTDDIIFSIDKNYKLVTINASYQQLLFAITGRLEKEGDQVFTGRLGKELTDKWKSYFERAFEGEKFSIQEAIYNPFKGCKQYGLINFNPVFNANGEVDSVACFAKDITASTISYLALEKSKIELDKIFSASLDVICAVDKNSIFTKVSPASKHVWGYEPEEMIGHSIFEFIHPAYAEVTRQAVEKVKQSSNTTNFENKYIKKDGSIAIIEWNASWDAKEEIRYGVARDITEKKKNELALIESEKQYKTLFEDSPLPMFIWEFETKKILNCNYEALELYGYTRDEFLELTLLDIRPSEDIPILMAATKNEETYGKVHKQLWRHKKKNGDIIHVNLHAHILDYQGRRASLVLVNDITEKLKIEEDIKQTNERYEYVLKATSDAVWDCDIVNDVIHWSEGLRTLFGYDPAIYSGKSTAVFLSLVHPDDRPQVQKDLFEALASESQTWSCEFRFLKSNGDYAYVTEKGYIIRDGNNKAIRIVGSKRDVTERNKELLRLKLLESVITNTNEVVVISEAESYDTSGPRIIYVNEAFTTLTGYLPSEVIGKTPRIVQGSKTDVLELERLKQHMDNFEPCELTLINYKKSGEEYWVNFTLNPVTNKHGKVTHWVSLQRDVTDKKLQEIVMMKAIIKAQEDERYEIGGELHDNVSQILTSGKITLKMLRKYLQSEQEQVLNEAIDLLGLASSEIRNLSHRLAPAFFADTTIEEAFTNLIRTFNIDNQYQINIHFNEAFKEQPAKREFQLNIYRILQEQLKNILKHAKATIIEINGNIENDIFKLTIIDNGVGFNINQVRKGIGIANMKRRTELFSGEFNIVSTHGKGCILTVEVPVKEII